MIFRVAESGGVEVVTTMLDVILLNKILRLYVAGIGVLMSVRCATT